MSTNNATGYGPSNNWLIFDGDERKYELKGVKISQTFKIEKLSKTILTPQTSAEAMQLTKRRTPMPSPNRYYTILRRNELVADCRRCSRRCRGRRALAILI